MRTEKIVRWIAQMLSIMLLFSAVPAGVRAETGVEANASVLENLSQEKVDELENRIRTAWDGHLDICDVSDLELLVLDVGSVQDVYFGLLYRNPEYYYVDLKMGYDYTYDHDLVTGEESSRVFKTIKISYTYTAAQKTVMDQKLKKAAAEALSGVKAKWSDLEKALYLHDYLCLNGQYDTSLQKFTAYDALVGKKAMCQGYSQAYLYLLGKLGIESYMVYSKGMLHAWNLVKINNVFYHTDVTWDDPTADRMGKAKHTYFLKSASHFAADGRHGKVMDWKIFNGFDPQTADSDKYDSAVWDKTNTAFVYAKNKWFNFDTSKKAIFGYTCNGKKMKRAKKMVSLKKEKWPVFGNSSRIYDDLFTCISSYKNKVYYSTATDVWQMKPGSGKVKIIYTLKKKQKKKGYIYGIFITAKGRLKIQVSDKSINTGKTYKVKNL